VDHATVFPRLHEKLRFKFYCLRWVLCLLAVGLMAKPKVFKGRSIPSLETARNDGWRHMVTGDESLFLLLSGPYRMWALVQDEGQQKPGPVSRGKSMFTIIWNQHGFRVIGRLLIDAKINIAYYTSHNPHPVHQGFFPQRRNPHGKQLLVQVDNCSVHRSVTTESFMKTWDMVSMPHPPHSLDLAPSDFHLFLTVCPSKNLSFRSMKISSPIHPRLD
jgi:hypothetical protein